VGVHGACKHVLAVFDKVKSFGRVKPQWGKKGSFTGLQYLADRIAKGEMRILNVERVAARYVRRVITRTRKGM
jgi:hypothetical protein